MAHCAKCGHNLTHEHGKIRRIKSGSGKAYTEKLICYECADAHDARVRVGNRIESFFILVLILCAGIWGIFFK